MLRYLSYRKRWRRDVRLETTVKKQNNKNPNLITAVEHCRPRLNAIFRIDSFIVEELSTKQFVIIVLICIGRSLGRSMYPIDRLSNVPIYNGAWKRASQLFPNVVRQKCVKENGKGPTTVVQELPTQPEGWVVNQPKQVQRGMKKLQRKCGARLEG